MKIPVDTERKASDRMIAFLFELLHERVVPENAKCRLLDKLNRHQDTSDPYRLPFDQGDKAIKWLLFPGNAPVKPGVVPSRIRAMPKAAPPSCSGMSLPAQSQRDVFGGPHDPVPPPGLEALADAAKIRRDPKTLPTQGAFRYEGAIYIVVAVRGNPNRHYAMKMIETPKRLTTSGKVVNFDFVGAPGIIWRLYEEHRLPPEEIKDLMIAHRMCIYPGCYRVLKAAKSVERGAGKTHARKLGLIP